MALAYDGAIQRLIDAFGRLPGIGPKGAQRIAFYMLSAPEDEARDLAEAIEEVKAKSSADECEMLLVIAIDVAAADGSIGDKEMVALKSVAQLVGLDVNRYLA